MKSFFAAMTLAVGSAPLVCAEPLVSQHVSADAQWLVHIDVDAIKTGSVARAVGALWLKLPGGAEHLRRAGAVVGLNPAEDLRGITIYGRRYAEPAAVVVLRATVDRERLMAFLQGTPGFRTQPYGDHELVEWTANPGKKDEHTVTGSFHGPGVIVFGRDGDEVRKALDVLDGRSPGLGEDDLLSPGNVAPGTMIQARAVDLAEVELPFKSPLVRKSKRFCVALGEHEGEAFAAATATTESTETAEQLRAVVEGLLAMAELEFDSDEQVTRLLETVKVSSDGKTVRVEYRGPPGEVLELIGKAWTKQLRPK